MPRIKYSISFVSIYVFRSKDCATICIRMPPPSVISQNCFRLGNNIKEKKIVIDVKDKYQILRNWAAVLMFKYQIIRARAVSK